MPKPAENPIDMVTVSARLDGAMKKKAADCYRILNEEYEATYGNQMTRSQVVLAGINALYKELKNAGKLAIAL